MPKQSAEDVPKLRNEETAIKQVLIFDAMKPKEVTIRCPVILVTSPQAEACAGKPSFLLFVFQDFARMSSLKQQTFSVNQELSRELALEKEKVNQAGDSVPSRQMSPLSKRRAPGEGLPK